MPIVVVVVGNHDEMPIVVVVVAVDSHMNIKHFTFYK